jgi:hypothetical protein
MPDEKDFKTNYLRAYKRESNELKDFEKNQFEKLIKWIIDPMKNQVTAKD